MSLSRVFIFVFFYLASTQLAVASSQQETFLSICDTAMKLNDKITAKLMAERLSKTNTSLLDQSANKDYQNCLEFSGMYTQKAKPDLIEVTRLILELENELEAKCKLLLSLQPQIAVSQKICRAFWD